mgnify:CR=1 FL=1
MDEADGSDDTRQLELVRPLSLHILCHSETGPVRKNNQDSGYASPTMLGVADGMGGAAAGDLASAVAITELHRTDQASSGELAGDAMLEAMGGAISRANDRLADLVAWDHQLEGMGTTVCAAMFSGSQLGLAHIGDSRAYLLREGRLYRLTHDHSWVQSLVDEGRITEEEAAHHPHRSLLMKVLNGQPEHRPDFSLIDVKRADRFLFCSDGLCGLVDDRDIRRMLRVSDPAEALELLVNAAKTAGGYDNITVLVADVVPGNLDLDAVPPRIIGAAATVRIPDVPSVEHAAAAVSHAGAAEPAGAVPAVAEAGETASDEPPAGLIDPDANEEIRYAPRVGHRRNRIWTVVISVLVAVGVLTGAAFGWRSYTASRYYLGPVDDRVGIYRGLPDTILGRPLGELVEVRPTKLSDLPVWYADQVRSYTYQSGSLAEASATADQLAELAKICIARRQASQSPSPSPGPSPGVSPGGSASTPGSTSASTSVGLPTGSTSALPTGSPRVGSTPTGTAIPADREAC